MRAKLLLNLRKNSLLLKVPKGWDYATMKLGVEPELTEEDVKAKHDILQQECKDLTEGYKSEAAYKLAEKLIPLDKKIEIDKLKVYDVIVQKDYPTKKIILFTPPIKIKPGYTKIVKQDDMNCGRAALSNFFGIEGLLAKGNPSNKEETFDLNEQRPNNNINMGSICNLRAKYAKLFNVYDKESDECPNHENYSINVLSVVLQILGYQSGEHIVFSGNPAEVSKNNHEYLDGYLTQSTSFGHNVDLILEKL